MDGNRQRGQKLALLSNVNMNLVIRMLQKQVEVYETEGYGNELGILMNPSSSYHAFGPDITFLAEDLMELLEHDLDPEAAGERIDGWFARLEEALVSSQIYYIGDAYLQGAELAAADRGRKAALEGLWQRRLEEFCKIHANVRILPYHRLVETLGEENAFSLKMWYMGRILLSNEAQKRLCALILDRVRVESGIPKKVLLLDLDNTLWGGLAGEHDRTPVVLSEEHAGLAYKNLQRLLLEMQKQGVLLGIVSKNNEQDAMEILKKHPHMVLRPEAFAAKRINWTPKHENIREIARELNLGLDSFVFWDDSPAERQLVKEMLPQVEVPDFPDKPEELAPAMAEIFREYFEKAFITEEDRKKTAQYTAFSERNRLREVSGSFEAYLRDLEIAVRRMDPKRHVERLLQLMNKTNQFNLTTRRYTRAQIAELLEDADRCVYLYNVADRFGDNGITAVLIADCSGEAPVLTDFVMSCRIMGRKIEDALVEDVEKDLRSRGWDRLRGMYLPTAKNAPVSGLYERLGYVEVGAAGEKGILYEIGLAKTPERRYDVRMEEQDPEAGK